MALFGSLQISNRQEILGFCCLYENIKMKQKVWGFCLFVNLKINSEAKNELSLAISCLVWARPRYLCQLKGIATSRVNKVENDIFYNLAWFSFWLYPSKMEKKTMKTFVLRTHLEENFRVSGISSANIGNISWDLPSHPPPATLLKASNPSFQLNDTYKSYKQKLCILKALSLVWIWHCLITFPSILTPRPLELLLIKHWLKKNYPGSTHM